MTNPTGLNLQQSMLTGLKQLAKEDRFNEGTQPITCQAVRG